VTDIERIACLMRALCIRESIRVTFEGRGWRVLCGDDERGTKVWPLATQTCDTLTEALKLAIDELKSRCERDAIQLEARAKPLREALAEVAP
jgi:hypothetical protein